MGRIMSFNVDGLLSATAWGGHSFFTTCRGYAFAGIHLHADSATDNRFYIYALGPTGAMTGGDVDPQVFYAPDAYTPGWYRIDPTAVNVVGEVDPGFDGSWYPDGLASTQTQLHVGWSDYTSDPTFVVASFDVAADGTLAAPVTTTFTETGGIDVREGRAGIPDAGERQPLRAGAYGLPDYDGTPFYEFSDAAAPTPTLLLPTQPTDPAQYPYSTVLVDWNGLVVAHQDSVTSDPLPYTFVGLDASEDSPWVPPYGQPVLYSHDSNQFCITDSDTAGAWTLGIYTLAAVPLPAAAIDIRPDFTRRVFT